MSLILKTFGIIFVFTIWGLLFSWIGWIWLLTDGVPENLDVQPIGLEVTFPTKRDVKGAKGK